MLDINGDIAIAGHKVIGFDGRWLGDTTGLHGAPGINGATWYSGTTAPQTVIGSVNDFYLNTLTDSIYHKGPAGWLPVAYIKGSGGQPGTNGSSWFIGPGNPGASLGSPGDLYLNTVTDSVLVKRDHWQPVAYVRGSSGINGSTWYTGPTVPSPELGNENDLYLNTATDSIYRKNNGWRSSAYIRGSKGDKGDRGDKGDKGDQGDKGDEGSCSCTVAAIAAAAEATAAAATATAAATEASGAATEATAAAAEATGSAAEASGSATRAVTSETNAKTSETNAKTSEMNAKTSEENAKTSETNAKASADSAASSAEEARRAADIDLGGDLSGKPGNASVIKLRGNALASTAPSEGNFLKWLNGNWTPANVDTLRIFAGSGIRLDDDTVIARTNEALWNAGQLQGNKISTISPKNRQVLKWINNQWTPDSGKLIAGPGIRLNGDSVIARVGEALWNTRMLQGRLIDTAAPLSGQLLRWKNGRWRPDSLYLKAGKGIRLNKDSVIARVNEPLWNAGLLQGYVVDTLRPQKNQILAWGGSKWRPINPDYGWALDSVNRDTSNLYAKVKGNVGIGTNKPLALFHVQGGSGNSSDSAFVVNRKGNVGIGTTNPDERFKLSVNGEIRAVALTIESGWADYVFDRNYRLRPLGELSRYIEKNRHLPDMPSEQEIRQTGLNVAKTQELMMVKIEELSLYMIQLKKQNEQLKREIGQLKRKTR
ncbi:hypothetical protein [Mucilaginibacter mallensis]|nr:hypothetical protein [Mucilaginibacter mallensis]